MSAVDDPVTVRLGDLHSSMAASPVALAVIDRAGCIRDANSAFADALGMATAVEVIGSSGYRYVTDTNQPKAHHLVNDIVDGLVYGWTTYGETRRADGHTEPNFTWARRLSLVEGPMLLLGLSAPRTANAAWLGERPTLDRLAVLTTDHDWRIADASSDSEVLLGVAHPQLIGLPLLGMIHPLDAISAVPALAHLETEREAVSLTLRVRVEGDWRDSLLTASRLCSHRPPRLVCLLSPSRLSVVHDPLAGPVDPIDRMLTEVIDGEILPEVTRAVLRRATKIHSLSGRQWEIVARVMRGQSAGDIASSMFLSPGTVRNQLTTIFRQFGVRSQAGLLSALYEGGMSPKSCE
jgi:DNA-binding CsgD family transcriptional regulator/PAS domain-containing protein